jgi:hypothetical protein
VQHTTHTQYNMGRCHKITWTTILAVWFVAVLASLIVWFVRSMINLYDKDYPEDQNPWGWDWWDVVFGILLFVMVVGMGVVFACPHAPPRLVISSIFDTETGGPITSMEFVSYKSPPNPPKSNPSPMMPSMSASPPRGTSSSIPSSAMFNEKVTRREEEIITSMNTPPRPPAPPQALTPPQDLQTQNLTPLPYLHPQTLTPPQRTTPLPQTLTPHQTEIRQSDFSDNFNVFTPPESLLRTPRDPMTSRSVSSPPPHPLASTLGSPAHVIMLNTPQNFLVSPTVPSPSAPPLADVFNTPFSSTATTNATPGDPFDF